MLWLNLFLLTIIANLFVIKYAIINKTTIFAMCKFTTIILNKLILKRILSHIIKYGLPLLLGLGIFWLLYRQFDFNEILSILQSDINFFWVALSMIVGVLSHIVRALRWRLQLVSLGINPSFSTICNAVFGTYAFNLVLPRFGELWRCTYIANHEKSSFSRVLGSVLSERCADTLTVLAITLIVFLSQMGVAVEFFEQSPQLQEKIFNLITSPWLYIVILAVVATIWVLLAGRIKSKITEKLQSVLFNMWDGFKSVISMQNGKIMFFVYTIMIWSCYFLQLYICIFAFDWMSHVTIMQALVLFVLGSIGMAVPVQGGIGPWHAAVIFGMTFYGFGYEQSGAFALVAHGSQMIVTVLLGIYTTIAILFDKRKNDTLINN